MLDRLIGETAEFTFGIFSKSVCIRFNPFSPLYRGKTLVKGFIGDRLSKGNHEMAIPVLIGFVGKKKHLQVDFDSKGFSKVGEVVKEIGATTRHMDGNDIPFGLPRLGNDALLPRYIPDDSLFPSGYQSGRKGHHLYI